SLRVGGGAYERPMLGLWVVGPDGRIGRWGQFGGGRDAEAVSRFDELIGEPDAPAAFAVGKRETKRGLRCGRPNTATALRLRFGAATAARDIDAVASLFTDGYEFVHHPTNTTFGRENMLGNLRDFVGAQDQKLAHEPLATLGETLVLCRLVFSFSELSVTDLPIGAVDMEAVVVIEADTPTQHSRVEEFAANRLGDAVVRLYERYAELCPEGRARDRAAVTARAFQAFVGPLDRDRFAAAFAPA